VNRDQLASHQFRIKFHDDATHDVKSFTGRVTISTFGSEQYKWNPASTAFMAHSASAAEQAVFSNTKGHADPDGPAVHITKDAPPDASYEIPAASMMVVRGKLR
jgi:hypothetical protein